MDKTINAENQGQPDAESCPSEKEQAILNAATRLFSQYGYTGTTTVSIAQEANVSEKTLFKYFHTKQELYNKALYPSIMTLIKEKIGRSQENDRGIYGILHDLYQ
ncbi:MAG: TetR/AcrR family transcriptional regulator, partial [Clostridia bacterium]|nr:TetR/AcrR family transcriptional regulator [Clostridia bacterium]